MTVCRCSLDIFQTVKVALISAVEEVVAHDVQAHQPAIVHAYVGTCREVNQCVRRCSRFSIVVTVEMVLP